MVDVVTHASHRWSGWPGAWCLDCGIEDPVEIALADGKMNDDMELDPPVDVPPCAEPGSKRHDPYASVKT